MYINLRAAVIKDDTAKAFSSEVDTGSHQENASNRESRTHSD
jgi:hypothetical protein